MVQNSNPEIPLNTPSDEAKKPNKRVGKKIMSERQEKEMAESNGNGKNAQTTLMAGGIILSIGLAGISGIFQLMNPRGDITAAEYRLSAGLAAEEARIQHEIDELKAERSNLASNQEVHHVVDDIKEIKTHAGDFVKLDTYKEYGIRVDKSIDSVNNLIKLLQADMVTRAEHLQHWKQYDDVIAVLRSQVLDINKDYSPKEAVKATIDQLGARVDILSSRLSKDEEQTYGTYNPGKQLENLQSQLNDLRKQLGELIIAMNSGGGSSAIGPFTGGGQRVTPVLPLAPAPVTPSR